MKKFLVIILIVSSTMSQAYCQWIYDINFDSKQNLDKVFIDTISNPNNCWQIGKPSKASLLAANSSPNVIATDTLNPYPANDTSSFIITYVPYEEFVVLFGYYYVNSDSLADYGTIEYSPDNGKTWICLVNDSINLFSIEPILTGNSKGWASFAIQLYCGAYDTWYFKFSFISDSISTNKGGLMFDDILLYDWWESIEDPSSSFHLFPNPANDALFISSDHNLIGEVEVFNPMGEKVLRQSIPSNSASIDISALKTGVYFVLFKNNSGSFQQKFMKL